MADRYHPPALEPRFWPQVVKGPECWEWTGHQRNGYGSIRAYGRQLGAHRVAYQLAFGPIPAGLTIDHLCRNKLCVNPAHLEPVTIGENVRRWARTITHCPTGHPYDEANTWTDRKGHRQCRACGRKRAHASYLRALLEGQS
jgi:hypothetical protein